LTNHNFLINLLELTVVKIIAKIILLCMLRVESHQILGYYCALVTSVLVMACQVHAVINTMQPLSHIWSHNSLSDVVKPLQHLMHNYIQSRVWYFRPFLGCSLTVSTHPVMLYTKRKNTNCLHILHKNVSTRLLWDKDICIKWLKSFLRKCSGLRDKKC